MQSLGPLVLEVVPPPITWDKDKIDRLVDEFCMLLERESMDLIMLTDLVSESRIGGPKNDFIPKIDNLLFWESIKQKRPSVIPIPCKVCVLVPKREFARWVNAAYAKGVRNVVLVGGESDGIRYPGYTVLEAADFIKKRYPDMNVGGITIFTRPGEAARIVAKKKHGIDFFFSQIIFESSNLKQVLLQLTQLCEAEGIDIPHIYISLAPAGSVKHIEFMQWLGVEFPSAIRDYLISGGEECVMPRTFEIIERTLEEIFALKECPAFNRLGFNIEHLFYQNLDLAEKLLRIVKERIAIWTS